jgi:uncharacterized protein
MTTALWCVAVQGLLLFGLGLWISLLRFFRRDYYFGAGSPTSFVTKLSRAHGNTAEFVPFLSVLMIYLGARGSPDWIGWVIVGATVSRALVVIGFLTCATLERISVPKAIGAIGTYAFGLVLTLAIVLPWVGV